MPVPWSKVVPAGAVKLCSVTPAGMSTCTVALTGWPPTLKMRRLMSRWSVPGNVATTGSAESSCHLNDTSANASNAPLSHASSIGRARPFWSVASPAAQAPPGAAMWSIAGESPGSASVSVGPPLFRSSGIPDVGHGSASVNAAGQPGSGGSTKLSAPPEIAPEHAGPVAPAVLSTSSVAASVAVAPPGSAMPPPLPPALLRVIVAELTVIGVTVPK